MDILVLNTDIRNGSILILMWGVFFGYIR
jgi:hypothetical protein